MGQYSIGLRYKARGIIGRAASLCAWFILLAGVGIVTDTVSAAPAQHLRIAAAQTAADTGIIQALADDFRTLHPGTEIEINSVGALAALELGRAGKVDFVITHIPANEQLFVDSGFGLLRTTFMYDEFAILGPPQDPLGLARERDLGKVLKRLAAEQVAFLVASDRSGTENKLNELWLNAGVQPGWVGYENTGASSRNTLLNAATFEAYTFVDLGTYYVESKELAGRIVPLYRDNVLLRNFYSGIVVNPERFPNVNQGLAESFLDYLVSERAQESIQHFGNERFGTQIFTPAASFDDGLRVRRTKQELARQTRIIGILIALSVFLIVAVAGVLILFKARKKSEETVLKLNQDLERRVDARTKELAIANEELTYQALHDALTDIPNRTLLYDRLQQAILAAKRERKSVALMMMDLDRFKEINDTMGHHSGDLVLQTVATRLRGTLRQSDTVARLGGDEFAMVLPGIGDKDTAIQAAQKILNAVQTPLVLEGRNLDIGVSLGIALYPDQGEESGLLMQRADVAMYAAKHNKSGYALYDVEADRYSVDRLALQSELRHAISNHQLVLYYQPKIDFLTGHISGFEALVRWQHPRHGLMLPDDFIPLAERTGLIKPLTVWVLQEALRQCCLWHRDGLPLTVAVNISASNLQDPQFPELVATALATAGAQPAWLELEIIETAIMKEPVVAIDAIGKLNHLGIQLAIDDFGTGYSSMAYLKKLLVAKIKIDKSFVIDMNTNSNDVVIVRSLIGLGHNLGLSVVAEGVESAEVWDQLKGLGCDSAQGYNMSRPIPPDKLDDWLKHSPWGVKRE